MPIRKPIKTEDTSLKETKLHKLQQLTSASLSVTFHKFYSGSVNPNQSSSYWDFCHYNFYTSGSHQISSSIETRDDGQRFTNPWFGLVPPTNNTINPQWRTKFNSTGSVLSIGQYYYGEQIKPGSFKLTDNSHPSGTIEIKDDSYGNLYSTTATVSQSNHPQFAAMTSSKNYIGNIFYDYGIATITETGSHNGQELVNNTRFDSDNTTSTNVGGAVYVPNGWTNNSLDTANDSSSLNTNTSYIKTGDGSWYISASAHSEGLKTEEFSLTSGKKYHISADVYLKNHPGSHADVVAVRDINNRVDVSMNLVSSSISQWQQISGSFVAASTGTEQLSISTVSSSAEYYIDNVSVREEAPSYLDVGTGNYSLQFKATHTIFTHEWALRIEPNEYNSSMNTSARAVFKDRASGSSTSAGVLHHQSPFVWNDLTGSNWAPHLTTILLYTENEDEPVAMAKYPQPIKMRKDIGLNFIIKLDI
tara:strand:- start:90 stop:1514 length:1425 start_codon:yes stop_codon:yes gene_type:complete